MTAGESIRRALYRMAREAQARGDKAEADRLDRRVIELARREASDARQ